MSGACGLHCLKMENIGVRVGDATLLENVNLHAHCGELTAIIGRNGAGKSTLLKAILGDIPHTGAIHFSGHGGQPTDRRPRIGYVPQSLNLDAGSPTTVYDMAVIFTCRRPAFLPPSRRQRDKIRTHFARFSADTLLDNPAGRLSGGELQRVLLAIATYNHPDLLILDEPVSGVDNAGLGQFYALIDRLKATDDMVILLVSHDLDYVRRHADRVVLLDKTVRAHGTPEQVFTTPAFHMAFEAKGGAL
ncbi:MAG: metal ABC transporter ATP-binding protein [Acutalibacteraceae bacterium]|jgi:ABC-type Mn2+/Zn2+ transport system ATPase subunit